MLKPAELAKRLQALEAAAEAEAGTDLGIVFYHAGDLEEQVAAELGPNPDYQEVEALRSRLLWELKASQEAQNEKPVFRPRKAPQQRKIETEGVTVFLPLKGSIALERNQQDEH